MPRIRTIKPEFWSSPDTARASLVARLTYIGMWNWADDHGRGTLNLKELEGFLFPNDDVSTLVAEVPSHYRGSSDAFRDVVAEVINVFGVTVYEVDRRRYFEIPSWDTHQRNERRAKSKYPGPADGYIVSDLHELACVGKTRKFRDTITEAPTRASEDAENYTLGTGEQGNRGTGERGGQGSSNQLGYPQPVDNDPPSSKTHNTTAHGATANGATAPGGTPDQWSSPLDPRCYKHRNLPRDKVPACHDCADARKWFKDKDQAAKNARRAAIDNCDMCDDNGFRTIHQDGRSLAIKCDHGHPYQPPF